MLCLPPSVKRAGRSSTYGTGGYVRFEDEDDESSSRATDEASQHRSPPARRPPAARLQSSAPSGKQGSVSTTGSRQPAYGGAEGDLPRYMQPCRSHCC